MPSTMLPTRSEKGGNEMFEMMSTRSKALVGITALLGISTIVSAVIDKKQIAALEAAEDEVEDVNVVDPSSSI